MQDNQLKIESLENNPYYKETDDRKPNKENHNDRIRDRRPQT